MQDHRFIFFCKIAGMSYIEVKYLQLNPELRKEALRQMAEINRVDEFHEAVTSQDFAYAITDSLYNPDKDFYFMLYDDSSVKVRSKSAQ